MRADEYLRFYRCRRRFRWGGRGASALGQPAQQGAAARSRRAEPSLVVYPGRFRPADQEPDRQLALRVGAGANTNGRRIPVPRGKLLGGSSAINGMAFVRGQAQDFDTWAQMGNRGWSYADILPFFKRMESYKGDGDALSRPRGAIAGHQPAAERTALPRADRRGGAGPVPHNPDYNGHSQEGIAMSQATITKVAA